LGFGFGFGAGAGGVELGTGLEEVGWLELGGAGFDPLVQPLRTATPQHTPTSQTRARPMSPSNPRHPANPNKPDIGRVVEHVRRPGRANGFQLCANARSSTAGSAHRCAAGNHPVTSCRDADQE